MINVKNFLLSGFTFTKDEYELRLQFILINSILAIISIVLAILSFLRYINNEHLQALIDLIALSASLITLALTRLSKKSINYSVPTLISLFYFLISFSFRHIGLIVSTWYLLLMLAAFFLKGKNVGLFVSLISLLAIFVLEKVINTEYTFLQYFYITIPIIVGMTFLYLYEQRNELLHNLLQKQKSSLQEEVYQQTKELALLLTKSEELSSIMRDSLVEIYIVDFDTDRYLYVNNGAIKALGYTQEELLNKDVYDINTSMMHESVALFKERILQEGNAMNISQHVRKDGSSYGVQSFMHKITYEYKDAYVIFDIQISQAQKAQSEILKEKETLAHQAHYDTLTQLPNRVLMHDRLHQSILKARRNKTKFALLFVDLDHFKEVNDNYGHEAGDFLLKEVSKRLKKCVRESDTVSRLSGDEFLIILEDFHTNKNLSLIAQQIVEKLQEPVAFEKERLIVTCSIGISIYPDNAKDGPTLIKYADRAMYNAKNLGKNNFKFYR
jgi:diguanylate cyclase (GGDEF)-like protein/PAS domain S-box-containing protein